MKSSETCAQITLFFALSLRLTMCIETVRIFFQPQATSQADVPELSGSRQTLC
jgi:hypothetical protein